MIGAASRRLRHFRSQDDDADEDKLSDDSADDDDDSIDDDDGTAEAARERERLLPCLLTSKSIDKIQGIIHARE